MKFAKILAHGIVATGALAGFAAAGGCLTRPVTEQDPTTKVNFTNNIQEQAVDKIDLLFDVDNSRSMSDKQALLAAAVPDLLSRLITPNCVDNTTGAPDGSLADPTKPASSQCANPNSSPEFKPIVDMHIAIVDSSMGGFGSDACGGSTPPAGYTEHDDDHGQLLNRGGDGMTGTETQVQQANPSNFLAWFPTVDANQTHTPPANPTTDQTALATAFGTMVKGVGQFGCGFEAQMESWYHFLIQPDPWQTIGGTTPGTSPAPTKATYQGVNGTIIQQRHDFLRPDSLVAVIVLTDENDSSVDPLSTNGQGWLYENTTFPSTPAGAKRNGGSTAPSGTSVCETNPADPNCTSCGFGKSLTDPNCTANGGYLLPSGSDPSRLDGFNERFFHMKARFGVDPQYPVSRYINGLKGQKVPSQASEHNAGGTYIGTGACQNPLFASTLPSDPTQELCNLPQGSRASDLVFFAVVGGVPNSLLHFDPTNEQNSEISDADWVKILGQDPINYNYTGIDVHMIESIVPRCTSAQPGCVPPSATVGDNGSDPDNGRETDWSTETADPYDDLQYACTFPFAAPKDCTQPLNKNSDCDCNGAADGNPPLCQANGTTQTRGKAYPTIREFEVVHGLGQQGIIASLCPHVDGSGNLYPATDPNGQADPLFGYRPAVKAIVDRLKNALEVQCLPTALTPDQTGDVPCLVLATLQANPGPESDCSKYGMTPPDPDVLAKFIASQQAEQGDGGVNYANTPVCVLPQQVVPIGQSCKDNTQVGWCYVINSGANTPAGRCNEALLFSAGTDSTVKGATFALQCIQEFGAGTTNGTDGG